MQTDSERLRVSLAPRFLPLCRGAAGFLLASEDAAICETGLAAEILAAAMRQPEAADIEKELGGVWGSNRVRGEIEALVKRGILQCGTTGDPARSAWWDAANLPPAAGKIALVAVWDGCSADLRSLLQLSGIQLCDDAPQRLVVTDDYLRPELAAIDAGRQPWLLAKPVGHTVLVGPLFRPGSSPCWSCMALRMRPHRWQQAAFYGWSGDRLPPQPSVAALPATLRLAASLIANSAILWAARGSVPELESAILSFDTRTLRQHRSILRRHPECPHCGRSTVVEMHRGPLHDLVSPLTGMVSGIDVTDQTAGGFFHALACFAAPLPAPSVRRLLRNQQAVGKGATQAEAETCAIAEAAERYSVIYRGDERRVTARIDRLDAIPPADILLFSERQYREREHWNATHSEIQWVPERFDPAQEIEWTEVRRLGGGAPRFVPTAFPYMYYDFGGAPVFCNGDSNGCAAGRSLEEALTGALLELIERDAVAIWWYNRLVRPTVALSSFGDGRLLKAADDLRREGRRLYLIDITTDLGIPVYVALAPKEDGSEPCFATAAAVAPASAAYKAVAEVSQVCFWAAGGGGTEELLSWIRSSSIHEQRYLQGGAESPARQAPGLTGEQALDFCIRALEGAGLEGFYLDLTRAEIGVPVVRAIVPGLRHFWARLGPGRLYEVPVRMGWAPRPLTEAELNPVPCMI